ncbi:sensor histidine kinase [Embleya sp. NPDC050493]|uniref:sensor histidine kinase n=1 Tax=Embleya sp. NPDC050493 TaxID=3363989 RepID=UPI00379042A2
MTRPASPTRRRQSVRLRLTVLYGTLFLVSGIALLAITYLLVAHESGQAPFSERTVRGGDHASPAAGPPPAEGGLQQRVDARSTDLLHELLTQSGIAVAIMTVVSVGLGWFTAGRVLRPLRTIIVTTRDISAGSLDRRLALRGPDDELKELGDTIDDLLSRLEAAFNAQRSFAANASHELRTPLTRARTLVEVGLADPEPTVESLRRVCERVLIAGRHQERLIEALLTLARGERGVERRDRLQLDRITRDALRSAAAPDEGATPTPRPHIRSRVEAAPMWGDGRLVERLVANLVDNAVRHNVPGGNIEVATSSTPAGGATLTVANTGPIIRPDEIPGLLRPFRRLGRDRTAARDGHGLGLAIVHAVVTCHGAELAVAPRPDGGLTVTVTFPPDRPVPHATTESPAGRGIPVA